MLQQINRSGVGIRFNQAALATWMGLYDDAFSPSLLQQQEDAANGDGIQTPKGAAPYQANANIVPPVGDSLAVQKLGDLLSVPFWWILECFPFKRRYQDLKDSKKRWKVSFWWVGDVLLSFCPSSFS